MTTQTTSEQQDKCISVTNNPTTKSAHENTEHAAIAYAQSGLSVLPVKENKSPALQSLDSVKKTIASQKEISSWYASANHGVGVLCGAISGNIECLDIDEKWNVDSTSLLEQLIPLVEELSPGLISKLVHETSKNGGHHFVYRCPTIERSKKLARRKPTEEELKKEPNLKSTTLIETRGE